MTTATTHTTAPEYRNLSRIVGLPLSDEHLAAISQPLSEREIAALDAFAARLHGMSDEQIQSAWGYISPEVIAGIRDLFAGMTR